jgi:hypothetical protein
VDPLSLAAAAVGLLIPFFKPATDKVAERAGETIADAAIPRVKALFERVRARLAAAGGYQGALLEGVRQEPDDPGRQEVLKAELAKIIVQDQQFASELARLVSEIEQAVGVQVTATDAGVVAGRDVHQHGQYVAGRDMTIGRPQ